MLVCATCPHPAGVDVAFNNEIAALHNLYRARHGTPGVVYNATLAAAALAWAQKCNGDHNTTELQLRKEGENL